MPSLNRRIIHATVAREAESKTSLPTETSLWWRSCRGQLRHQTQLPPIFLIVYELVVDPLPTSCRDEMFMYNSGNLLKARGDSYCYKLEHGVRIKENYTLGDYF